MKTRNLLVVAITATLAAATWLLFFGGSRTDTDSAGGPGGVAAPDTSADQKSTGQTGDATTQRGANATHEAFARSKQNADQTLRGVVAGRSGSLAGTKVELVVAHESKPWMTNLLTFTRPEQFRGLEKVFGPPQVAAVTTLAADGSFVFAPPPGRYRIELDHDLMRLAAPPVVELEKNEHEDVGLLKTAAAGAVLVIVQDRAGKPVADADLQLSGGFDPMSFADPEKLGDIAGLIAKLIPKRAKTNARGIGIFGRLDKGGSFKVGVEAEGYAPASSNVNVLLGMQRVVRVRLPGAATLLCDVVNLAGGAVEGARVTVLPEPPSAEGGAVVFVGERFGRKRSHTGKDGVAEVDSLPAGRADITVQAPGYLPWTGSAVFKADEKLTRKVKLDPGLSVSGKVLDEAGAPVGGARVASVPELGTTFMGFKLSSMLPDAILAAKSRKNGATTDAEGRFTLRGCAEGSKLWLLAVADGFAPGQIGPVEPSTKDHVIRVAALGRIAGRVVRDEDGEPVADFEAFCAKTQYVVFEGRVGRQEKGEQPGAFELAEVPQGKQTLVITAAGRSAVRRTVEVAGETLDLGEIRLGPASGIEGIVVDESGQPVEGARVRLSKGGLADYEMLAKLRGARMAETDAAGRFVLEQIPARRCKLVCEKTGYALERSKIVKVAPGEVTRDVRIVLDRGGSLTGRIVDKDHVPQRGWRVSIKSDRQVTTRMAETDAAGSCSFAGLAPGIYVVQAFPPNWMTQIATWSRRNQRVEELGKMPDMGKFMSEAMRSMLQTKATVRAGNEAEFELVFSGSEATKDLTEMSGRVTIGGEPVASGFVEFAGLGAAPVPLLAPIENGSYRYQIRPGTYRVRVRAGWFSAAAGTDEMVRVPKAPKHAYDLALPGGRISGRVVFDASGEPAPHVMVHLQRAGSAAGSNPSRIQDVGQGVWLTDDEGRFRFDGLAAGTYTLATRELSLASGSGRGALVGGIVLAAGESREKLTVRIGKGAELEVSVEDGNGPRAQAVVRLLDASGQPAGIWQAALTDNDGKATFSGLSSGSFRALADAKDSSPVMSDKVLVSEGSLATVALRLHPGVSVTVFIDGKLPEGRPGELGIYMIRGPDGRLIRAGPVPFDQIEAKAKKAKTGLTLGALQPGRYRVRFESPSLGVLEGEREVPDQPKTTWHFEYGK